MMTDSITFFWYGSCFGAGIVVAVITLGAVVVAIVKTLTEVNHGNDV
jgi:hypothetical protein